MNLSRRLPAPDLPEPVPSGAEGRCRGGAKSLQAGKILLFAVLALSACDRCAGKERLVGPSSTGSERPEAGHVERKSTDLRTALIQSYPEYRDTALLESSARLTRTIPGLTDAQRDAALQKLKWERVTDGGTGWVLNRFQLAQPAPETLELTLPLSVDDVGHLFLAPTSLSSMELALYLPRELPVGSERFELHVHYATSPERARALVRQAVTLLVANAQWKLTRQPLAWGPDAAADEGLPEVFTVEVTSVEGATIAFERQRGQVQVRYALDTVR